AFLMDIVWFLQRRLEFIRNLYRTATAPFCETMEKIEAGEPPYVNAGNPEYDSEPPYISEYVQASEAVEVVGHWCLIMVHASLKAFLEEYVDQMAARYGVAFGDAKANFSNTKASNWFERYQRFFLQEFQIDWHE